MPSPSNYSAGALFALLLLFSGLLLQWFFPGSALPPVSWPINLLAVLAFASFLTSVWLLWPTSASVCFLTSVPCAVSSTLLMLLLTILMGFLPQGQVPETANFWWERFRLYELSSSWPFLLNILWILSSLGLVIIKRFAAFSFGDLPFLMSHLGLWITLTCGFAGVGDLQRLRIELEPDKVVFSGLLDNGKSVDLPFALVLKKFHLESYLPKLVIRNNLSGEPAKMRPNLVQIEKGTSFQTRNLEVKVLEYLNTAIDFGGVYHFVNEEGAPPAALISVKEKNGNELEGWISSGSFLYPPKELRLGPKLSLVMTEAEAKSFRSDILLLTPKHPAEWAVLEVNRPLTVFGWKIYQLDYDTSKGRWSRNSVAEAVRDPWQAAVYFGLFLMAFSAVWKIGKKT